MWVQKNLWKVNMGFDGKESNFQEWMVEKRRKYGWNDNRFTLMYRHPCQFVQSCFIIDLNSRPISLNMEPIEVDNSTLVINHKRY